MMLQINPILPVMTPRGKAFAHFIIDYGHENDLYWVTFNDKGECWTWKNQVIRLQENITMGRKGR